MTAEERVLDAGYEDVLLLKDYSYDDALEDLPLGLFFV